MPFLAQPSAQVRLLEANYGDGVGTLAAGADPVEVSRFLFDQDAPDPNDANLSTLFTTWGQFIDHDLTLTPVTDDEFMTADGLMAPANRSEYEFGDDGARVPLNAITWQMDASMVYGASEERTDELRSFEDGKMLMTEDPTSGNGLLPQANPTTEMDGDIFSDNPVYLAGDVRANENPNLLTLHTVMVREHNYWAEQLAEEHPDWTDEQLFEGAREIVEYEIQQVTYNEWLPHLVGDAVPDDYAYDPSVNGQISVEFSTAGFRFGHTLVTSTLDRLNEDGTEAEGGSLGLMDGFFNHTIVQEGGIDVLLRGQLTANAEELDTQVVDDLNFFLENPQGVSGFSLVALNLLRSADHGLQKYVDARAELLGDIDPATMDPQDFSVITSDPAEQAALAEVYDSVFEVDLWVGGLAEDNIAGTQFGPLFTYIVSDQFIRIRAADETFGHLDPELGAAIIEQVQASTLSDILERNTDIDTIQDDPFLAEARGLSDIDTPDGTWSDDDVDLDAAAVTGAIMLEDGNDSLTMTGGSTISHKLDTGEGDDTVTMSSGAITNDLCTQDGDDTVELSGTAVIGDDLRMGRGDDTLAMQDAARIGDDVQTGSGNDTVVMEDLASIGGSLCTHSGDDTVSIGARASVSDVRTGHGNDTVTIAHGADVDHLNGGSGHDTLQITGGSYRIDWGDGGPGSGAGTVVYLDADGNETGETLDFKSIETITCFTPGTRVITARGKLPIEDLVPGDRVWTLDDGLQDIRWIGSIVVPAQGDFAPIRIEAGALGNTRALTVSPQHRMLLQDWRVELHCGEDSALAPAKALLNDSTIRRQQGDAVEYIHILFDRHQIVFAEGIASESFHPGAYALDTMEAAARDEILALFPQLADDFSSYGPAARPALSHRETQALLGDER